MTFYCWNCFAEMRSPESVCTRCGMGQDVARRDYVAKLRGALAHSVAETRRRAIFLLGEKRVAEAVGDLAGLLKAESDPFLVEEAMIALGKIGGDEALRAVLAGASHGSFIVRARAVQALVGAGGEWARAAIEIARDDPSAMVREAAASAKGLDR
jgi:HEAT repeat protein